MLGHGYTDKPGHPLEVSHYVSHLMAFFDAIGADRAHLSGESLGGWVASRAAIDHPDRIDRLVLNTAGGSQAEALRGNGQLRPERPGQLGRRQQPQLHRVQRVRRLLRSIDELHQRPLPGSCRAERTGEQEP